MFSDDNKIAEKRLEQILETLKIKDKDTLRAMFSKRVFEGSEMIDESIDYLFAFFQGEVISWEEAGGLIVDQSFRHGNRITEMKSFYTIDTNKQKYLIFIFDYTEDTANPENVGLYTLRVIKEEDKETQWSYWQDMKIPGIYRPEVSTDLQ